MALYNIRLLPTAYGDIIQARTWYSTHNTELPKKFTKHLIKSIEHISVNPFVHAIRYKNVRIAKISIFPYTIHYFVLEEKAMVVIIAVFHTSLNPENWNKRI